MRHDHSHVQHAKQIPRTACRKAADKTCTSTCIHASAAASASRGYRHAHSTVLSSLHRAPSTALEPSGASNWALTHAHNYKHTHTHAKACTGRTHAYKPKRTYNHTGSMLGQARTHTPLAHTRTQKRTHTSTQHASYAQGTRSPHAYSNRGRASAARTP